MAECCPKKNILSATLQYLLLMSKPLVFAAFVVFLWFMFFRENFKEMPEDTEIISMVTGGFLIFSAILPSLTISRLTTQIDEMRSAIIDKNYLKFRKVLANKVHPLMHIIIAIISLLAIVSLLMAPFHRLAVGVFTIAGLSFVHAFFFVTAVELDDPTKGCWQLDIPQAWLDELEKERREKNKECPLDKTENRAKMIADI